MTKSKTTVVQLSLEPQPPPDVKEEPRRVIIIGEMLAPPALVFIGTGRREERYLKWLKEKYMKACGVGHRAVKKDVIRSFGHLGVIHLKDPTAVWTFKLRTKARDEAKLENTLHQFIKDNIDSIKETSLYCGVVWD